jgi:hypothetical protein
MTCQTDAQALDAKTAAENTTPQPTSSRILPFNSSTSSSDQQVLSPFELSFWAPKRMHPCMYGWEHTYDFGLNDMLVEFSYCLVLQTLLGIVPKDLRTGQYMRYHELAITVTALVV